MSGWDSLWQAGAKPFEYSGAEKIGVSVNDETSKKLADYWGGLVKDGVVSTDPDFTDPWYQGLNQGKYATWLTAAWGPVFLSASAKDTSGKWRAAPLPQWNAGKNKAGNWGGSTSAVIKTTKNPIAAAKFAEFLNTDPESTMMLATQQFLFPADEVDAGRSDIRRPEAGVLRRAAGQRALRPRSAAPCPPSSSGRRSWTRRPTTGTRRSVSRLPTSPIPESPSISGRNV